LRAAEAGETADDFPGADALRLHEVDLAARFARQLLLALEQRRGPENGLERIIELVRHTRGEQADRRKPLLANDLPL